MNEPPFDKSRARNPLTASRHHHETFWQITIPLLVGGLIVLLLAGVIALGATAATQSQMADAAVIQLTIPLFIAFGLLLVILLALVFGLFWLILELPTIFLRVQIFFLRVQLAVTRFDDRLVGPVLRAHDLGARGRGLRSAIRRPRRQ
jgi:hypothetical protein